LAWLLLALPSNLVPLFIGCVVFVFHSLESFAFALVFAFRQEAAVRSLLDASALIPMAQMKPSNSRPMAVISFSSLFRRRHSDVALVQSVLRFPDNLLDRFCNPLLSLAQRRTDPRAKPVAPGRFNRMLPRRVRWPLEYSLGTAPL
jgi:hypothetical protein